MKFKVESDNEFEIQRIVNSENMALALWKISNIKRDIEKKIDSLRLNDDAYKSLDIAIEEIYSILDSFDINLDSMIE